MSEKKRRSTNEQTHSPDLPRPDTGRMFDRRHFLGGAALASLAAPIMSGVGLAAAPPPPEPKSGDFGEPYLNVRKFGARGDGKTDDTAAIQRALDAAGKQGGNVVLLSTGRYLVGSSLHIPIGVTLEGVSRAPMSSDGLGRGNGSCLLAVGGKGKPDGEPLFSLYANSTLCGVSIFYPEQTFPPVEYPWTIRQRGSNVSLVNVLLINPWQGVDFGTYPGGRYYIRGLYGQPLKTGLFIDKCYDVSRVEDVHFWPFWRNDAKTNSFTTREATAFRIGRADWLYMFNCFAIFYKIGYHFVHTPSGDPNVLLTQCGTDLGYDMGSLSVKVDACQPWSGISFLNGQFTGTVEVGKTNSGPVKFTNCGFFAAQPGLVDSNIAVLEGSGLTTFIGCHFGPSWVRDKKATALTLRSGRLTVDGCEFSENRRHISLEKGAPAAVITGNHFHGPAQISNQIGSRAKIGMNIATG